MCTFGILNQTCAYFTAPYLHFPLTLMVCGWGLTFESNVIKGVSANATVLMKGGNYVGRIRC